MAPAGYGDRVEGIHAVSAALAAGRVTRLYVDRARMDRLGEVLSGVDPSIIRTVDDVRSIADSRAPQGLVAECRPINPATLESLANERSAVLVLDHIEDPQNVGAIARSALAAGVTGLVVSARRAAPFTASTFKAAAGALESVPIAIVGSIPESLRRLKREGLWVVGLDAGGDRDLFGLELLTEPVALVVGAEGSGLAELTRKRCDLVASIPMAHKAGSLNASVSAALGVFEIRRVRSSTAFD